MSSSEKDAKGRGRGFGRPFTEGTSGNPGGRPVGSLKYDIPRAKTIGTMPELHAVLDEWAELAEEKLATMGATRFIATLQAEIRQACEIDLPPTAEIARAQWWRTLLPVAFRGPNGTKDSVWTYAQQEVGVRLLGKPKEHVVVEEGAAPPVDWKRVPEAERERLQASMLELLGYLDEPESATEH